VSNTTTPRASDQPHIDPAVLREQFPEYGVFLSKATILRKEKAGTFPTRFYISERKPAWRRSAILGWLSERESVTTSPALACNADRKPKRKKKART
jgi:hypothetical protein